MDWSLVAGVSVERSDCRLTAELYYATLAPRSQSVTHRTPSTVLLHNPTLSYTIPSTTHLLTILSSIDQDLVSIKHSPLAKPFSLSWALSSTERIL